MHETIQDPQRKIYGVSDQYDKYSNDHPNPFERQSAGCQVIEHLCEFDPRQAQGEQTKVAQHIAKGFRQFGKLLQPVYKSADQLLRRQSERMLAAEEQYQQTAEAEDHQTRVEQVRQRIIPSQSSAEASKDYTAPSDGTQRGQGVSALPGHEKVGATDLHNSNSNRDQHH